MRRPLFWIVGGRWDKLASATRLLMSLAVVLLWFGYQGAQRDAVKAAKEAARLQGSVVENRVRIDQLEATLRNANIPVPPPPTTTTTTTTTMAPRGIGPRPADGRPTTTTHPSPGGGPTTQPTTTVKRPTCTSVSVPADGTPCL